MTETPVNKSSSSPTEQAPLASAEASPEPPSFAPKFFKFFKGCGCLLVCVALAVSVAIAGHGDVESWGSGIAGVVILVFVVWTSGLIGWHKK